MTPEMSHYLQKLGSLATGPDVEVDVNRFTPAPRSRVLLCRDGACAGTESAGTSPGPAEARRGAWLRVVGDAAIAHSARDESPIVLAVGLVTAPLGLAWLASAPGLAP